MQHGVGWDEPWCWLRRVQFTEGHFFTFSDGIPNAHVVGRAKGLGSSLPAGLD